MNKDNVPVLSILLAVIIVALICTLIQQGNEYEEALQVEKENSETIYKYLFSCQAVTGATVEQIDAAYNYLFVQEPEVFPEGTSETLNQLGIQNE